MGWIYHPVEESRLGSQSHLLQAKGPKQAPRLKLTTGEGSEAKFRADPEQEESRKEQKGAEGSKRGAGESREGSEVLAGEQSSCCCQATDHVGSP
jgi:hypothetical protein